MMKMMNPSQMNSMMNYQPNSEFNIKFQTEINETLGNEGLIFISKSKEYSKKKKIPLIKLLQYYELLRANKASFNNQNCRAVCLYFLCKYDPKYIEVFRNEILPPINADKIIASKELLYLYYNIIEFEDTFHTRTLNQLIQVGELFKKLAAMEKDIQDYLLFNYYKAIENYYNKEYNQASNCCNSNVSDLYEEVDDVTRENDFFKYFTLKNTILTWRIIQSNSSRFSNEFLSMSNELYSQFKDDNIEIATKISLIAVEIYEKKFEYKTAIDSLEKAYKLLKKFTLKGDVEVNNSIQLFLQILSKLGYLYIMIGDENNSLRILRKIDKNMNIIEKEERIPMQIRTDYMFFMLVMKTILGGKTTKVNEIIQAFHSLNNSSTISEGNLINLYSFSEQDSNISTFYTIIKEYLKALKSNLVIPIDKMILCLFCVYNHISYISKTITTDPNKKQQKEYNSRIQNFSKIIIDYIKAHLNEPDLIPILLFDYVKTLIIKIYYFYFYSFYFEGKYKELKEEMGGFENIKQKLALTTNNSYSYIVKLLGDVSFKQMNYKSAIQLYEQALSLSKNKVRAALYFNIGLSYLFMSDRSNGKRYLTQALDEYSGLIKKAPNMALGFELQEKAKYIDDLMKKLNM